MKKATTPNQQQQQHQQQQHVRSGQVTRSKGHVRGSPAKTIPYAFNLHQPPHQPKQKTTPFNPP
ncbi:hypothetical protein E2C01_080686 [Portunus trituberculatus]|uniref:Uncharacterized protein n=1 Tax=Portunus trituberculatus TaxID=210409 RepID=A0A5B7IWS4_PORTR|nr:hypothetical protein [Portunus trituberculatus]